MNGLPRHGSVSGFVVATFAASSTIFAARVRPWPTSSVELLIQIAVFLVLAAVVGLGAAVPSFFCHQVARRTGLQVWWYYAVCGGIMGLALGSLMRPLMPGSALDGFAKKDFIHEYIEGLYIVGPMFSLSGVVGGVMYWLLSARLRVDTDKASTTS